MEKYTGFEIAVIGLAGRFPQSPGIREYWENLVKGRECVDHFSVAEAIDEGEPESLVNDPAYIRANAWLQGKEFFDAGFFGYRPDEAALMDPQIRVFHETCWHALEDSGYGNTDHKEKIGLFATASPNVNWEVYALLKNRGQLVNDFTAFHVRNITFLTTSISYKLNLKGPSIFLQTACSSSLVAIHEACNSLLWGECSMALAGGVTVCGQSKRGYLYQEGMIFSRDGKCRPFDADSSGTISGEGAGVVVLKRLKDALRHGDHVYAIIKGTGINNDGSNKVGYTAPGVNGQADAIRKAHKMAAVDPRTISYVETHGTATALGDPVEIEALNQAFGPAKPGSCAIGSVKSNIGHLDAAAGVAGFIKTVLSLKNKQIPASLHFTKANPKIEFDKGPFYVNGQLTDWKRNGTPLRAGVSSFGIGGTNAHVVLEEAPAQVDSGTSRDYQLIVLSAKTNESLARNAGALQQYIKEHPQVNLADICYTLQTGRERFRHRKILVCANHKEAAKQLSADATLNFEAHDVQEQLQHIIFLFPGQGSQYAGMCRDLYEKERFFREKVDECLVMASRYSSEDFRSILYPADEAGRELINDTRYAQPLLFIIEYSIARLLMQWGIQPSYMIGHSIGEYVAACLSGVFTMEDALRLVIRRGELMSSVERGSMLSIMMEEEALKSILIKYPKIDIAVINSPGTAVVSGSHDDVALLLQEIAGSGHNCKRLHTSHAFHSYMMDGILKAFEQEVQQTTISEPSIPYISNLTGDLVQYSAIREAGYWSSHLRNTVRFTKGAETLLSKGNAALIEAGPGQSLSNFIRDNASFGNNHHVTGTVRQANQVINDQLYLTQRLGHCWLHGIKIDWERYYAEEKRNRVPLPGYSFEKTEFPALVDMRKLMAEQGESSTPDTKISKQENYIHLPVWQQSGLPNDAVELSQHIYTFLLFAGDEDLSHFLKGYLEEYGQKVITLKPGHSFDWENLAESGVKVDHIIYCSALTNEFHGAHYENIYDALDAGYLGLSRVAASIAKAKLTEKPQITVVNNYLVSVGDEETDPLKATILGPVKIIPLELVNCSCKVIDLPYPFRNDTETRDYVVKIVNEIFYQNAEPLIAYRYNQRWVQSFRQPEENNKMQSPAKIVENGVYIVTGGFGGMGFSIAADIATNYKAQVILVHRSSFPARSEWDTWLLQNGEENDISRKIRSIQDLEQAESRFYLYQVNLGNEEEVRAFAEEVKQHHSVINGLIWAAGEVDYGGIIQKREKEDFIRYIRSKVHGLLLFEKYFELSSYDFIALFSSIGNVFYQTKFGQTAYNAANEFMSAYPLYARKKYKGHVFTINWCDWLDVGMTFKTRMKEMPAADVNSINAGIADGISPKTGISIFHRCLQSKLLQSIIFKGDLQAAIQLYRKEYSDFKESLHSGAGEKPVGEQSNYEEILTRIFARFFGKENIKPADDFFELGGDSLRAMTLLARINRETGVQLSVSDIYRCSTVQQLSAELALQDTKTIVKPIPKAPGKKYYALSSAQKRLFFLQLFYPETTVYNEAQSFWLVGNMDRQKLEHTFTDLIRRHEILRTVFVFDQEEPRQYVLDEFDFSVQELEYEEDPAKAMQFFVRPFRLQEAPLVRVAVMEKNEAEHLVILEMHHIITDGISHSVLVRDFMALYNNEELPALHLQYKDYSEWQQSAEQQQALAQQEIFWVKRFESLPPALELPADFPRPLVKQYKGDFIEFSLNAGITAKIKSLSAEEGASLFVALLSVYNILLSKLANQEDVVVGVPVAGRQHSDIEKMIGIFINVLPLRNRVNTDCTFREFLSAVKTGTLDCFDNQAYQYEELIDKLQVVRDTGRNPLFDILFSFVNFEKPALEIPGLQLKPCEYGHKISKFDCTLWAADAGHEFHFVFEYATSLFKKETIEKFADYFLNIAAIVADNPGIRISGIDILSSGEKQMLLNNFNDTAVDLPDEGTIVSRFMDQVQNSSSKVALVYEGKRLTYGELNELSGRLAGLLRRDHGIGADSLVGIMCERSEWLVIGLLGILKSGGAYVFVDPAYPRERMEYILQDSGAKVLLVNKALPEDFYYEGAVVNIASVNSDNIASAAVRPQDLCYVMYTSGSTGKPKGVMISHGNVVNFFAGMNEKLPAAKDDCMLAVTSASFDISVLELLWTLCNGIEVVMHPADISLSGLDRYVKGGTKQTDFSLFFFSSYDNRDDDKYKLLMESVRYADREGFTAVWTPERHFHEFGGLFPNPSVISSALSMITKNIRLRSGSVVLPLHDSLRVAEEWSVVDNLSKGRIGLSFASGWNPNDFAIGKTNYKERQQRMYEQVDEVKKLWSGQKVKRTNGLGQEVELGIYPAPVQSELPVWITSSGNEETFKSAGAMGAHILTHFLGQETEELARKIALYREARREHGHDPAKGIITLMLHTYIGEDINEVEQLVEKPFIEYLKSSIGLSRIVLEEGGVKADEISEENKQLFLRSAFLRYYRSASLIGTLGSCSAMVEKLRAIGVDEIACLVDFGIEQKKVLEGLHKLKELKQLFSSNQNGPTRPVTMLQCTPSFMKLILGNSGSEKLLQSLRMLLLGGEAVPPALVRRLRKDTGAGIYNMYGPTETTIWSCVHEFEQQPEKTSVGKPIANTQIYILDKGLQLLPTGVPGELFIGGKGVSRGYWQRPMLTEERFITNPFNSEEKIYKTGDIARWLPNGTIEILGREDQQVKIRGHRIEPGEIESAILSFGNIKEAIIIAKDEEGGGGKYLAGYFTAQEPIDSQLLKDHLRRKLPEHMIPSYLIQLDEMPLTPNGKTDRKALEKREIILTEDYQAPEGPTEQKLTVVWSEVLKLDKNTISVTANFFELGGHSIRAIHLMDRIQKEFSVKIGLRQIFENNSIQNLATYIESIGTIHAVAIEPVEKKDFYVTSAAQQRLFVEHMLYKDRLDYNVFQIFRIQVELSPERIEQTLQLLINRHESLRTSFFTKDDEIVQQVNDNVLFRLEILDQNKYASVKEAIDDFIRPFDLSAPSLVRGAILQSKDAGNLLLVDMHHIICDGISRNITMDDFRNLYRGKELLPLPLRYIDYAHWEKNSTDIFAKQKQYWQKQLSGELTAIDLPVLQSRDALDLNSADSMAIEITGDLYRQVKKYAASANVSDFMLLLSVYYILLSRMSGHTDIIVGTDAVGRSQPALKNIVGAFVNILPLRIWIQPQNSFRSLLQTVKNCVLEAYENQDFPFDQMLAAINMDGTRSPVEVYFSFQNFLESEQDAAGAGFVHYEGLNRDRIVRAELELEVLEKAGMLNLVFAYSTTLYDGETIGLFMNYYKKILTAVLENDSLAIENIELEPVLPTVSLA